jgi:hypothetical protein
MRPAFGFCGSCAKLSALLLAFGMGSAWAQHCYVDVEIVGRKISATELAAAAERLNMQATNPATGRVVTAKPEGVSKTPRGNPLFSYSLEFADEYQITMQHGLCTLDQPSFSHKCVADKHTAYIMVCTRPAPPKSPESKKP